jgi:hypothetical protein
MLAPPLTFGRAAANREDKRERDETTDYTDGHGLRKRFRSVKSVSSVVHIFVLLG